MLTAERPLSSSERPSVPKEGRESKRGTGKARGRKPAEPSGDPGSQLQLTSLWGACS